MLFRLETNPEKQRKYADFIDFYADKGALMDYLKHAIENNSLDNLFDPDLKEYWDMYQRLEIETEKDIFQAHFDKIKGEILTKGLTYA